MAALIQRSQPSIKQGYARSAYESANPNLWRGLIGAWVPALGPTGTTTLRDFSSHDNHGTLNGTMTNSDWVLGEKGYALDFDGSDDFVNVPDSNIWNFSANTLMAWIYPRTAAPAAQGRIISHQNGGHWVMGQANVGGLRYTSDKGPTEIVHGTITANVWQHVAIVRDTVSSAVIWYIDAAEVGSETISNLTSYSISNNVQIGRFSGSSEYFDGLMGDMRIYDRALPASEIREIYLDNSLALFRRRLTFPFPESVVAAAAGRAKFLPLLGVA